MSRWLSILGKCVPRPLISRAISITIAFVAPSQRKILHKTFSGQKSIYRQRFTFATSSEFQKL